MRRSRWMPMVFCVLAISPVIGGETADGDHTREIEQWRKDRQARLSEPDGWFSLVGLTWLEEGDNSCGSDLGSDVRLPESAPATVGVLRKIEGGVEIEAKPGAGVSIDGKKERRAVLRTDSDGDPSIVELGSIQFYLIERGGRIGVRIKDSESPALLAFRGLDTFPVEPQWRTEARFVPYDPPKPIAVPTVLGTINEQPSPGAVEFRMAARTRRLDVLPGGDGEYFIVFGDATNGKQTYGGGRFLYAAAADDQGRVVLDFNKAYNPPCAFTPYATCPLPPRQNRLALAVRAGEKKYAGGVDH
ncbi:MAG: DUF1684 domain-containing protein [bacterium]|nr:DUF1684 domain-containing protein [bacterium]